MFVVLVAVTFVGLNQNHVAEALLEEAQQIGSFLLQQLRHFPDPGLKKAKVQKQQRNDSEGHEKELVVEPAEHRAQSGQGDHVERQPQQARGNGELDRVHLVVYPVHHITDLVRLIEALRKLQHVVEDVLAHIYQSSIADPGEDVFHRYGG